MVEWLLQLPRRILVFIVIGAGIIFIVLSDPPRSVCDAQIEVFNEATKALLQKDEKKPWQKKTAIQELYDECLSTASPGGCYRYVHNVKKVLKSAQAVSLDCQSSLSMEAPYERVVFQTMELLVKIAWGSQPPPGPTQKMGWLNAADQALFCDLKRSYTLGWGDASWVSFVDKQLKELPGVSALTREEAWARTIMSNPCL